MAREDGRAEALRWLNRTHRNDYLAVDGVPGGLPDEPVPSGEADPQTRRQAESFARLRSQLPRIGFAELPLENEARSLAISADGTRVLVGTKAGTLHLVWWNAEERRWVRQIADAEMWTGNPWVEAKAKATPQGGLAPKRAVIRAVAFIDVTTDETRVAVGYAESQVMIVTFHRDGRPGPEVLHAHPQGQQATKARDLATEPRDRKRAQMRRFSRFINLVDLGRQGQARETGPILLGVARHGTAPVVVVRKSKNEYEVWDESRLDYSLKRVKKEGKLGEREWLALVDGTWQRGYLWLLTSDGSLVRGYARERNAEPDETKLPVVFDASFRIERPRTVAFQSIDACSMGLSVLAGNLVTFLPFAPESGEHPDPSDERLKEGPGPIPAKWFEVKDALDCAIYYPLGGKSQTDFARVLDQSNPVWTVVSSGEPGLTWVGWCQRESDQPYSPWQLPGQFTWTGGSVTHLRFAWPDAEGPILLACGTRTKLLIASVLDRYDCDAAIETLNRNTPRGGGDDGEGAWWRINQQIRDDFTPAGHGVNAGKSSSEDETPPTHGLECAGPDNLRRLAVHVVREWRDNESLRKSVEGRFLLNQLLRTWTLRILQRAYDMRPDLARELATTIYDRLWAALRRERTLNTEETKDTVDPAADIGVFAVFLRKWLIHGHTFAEKEFRRWEHYEMNKACGKSLDALVFLSKLLHTRVDAQWEADPLPQSAGAPTWDVVISKEGDFSVQSYTDGSIAAISKEGHVMKWSLGARLSNAAQREKDALRNLEIVNEGRCLRHTGTKSFADKYRHGPYARRLLLLQHPNRASRHILVFCLKGWLDLETTAHRRPKEDVAKKPFLVALVLALSSATGGVGSALGPSRLPGEGDGGEENEPPRLVIESVCVEPVSNDLFAFCEIPVEERETGWHKTIVAGTSGTWLYSDGVTRKETAFVELDIDEDGDGAVRIRTERISARAISADAGRRSAFSLSAHNPCWALVSTGTRERPVVWGGFKDGNIRRYERHDGHWYERPGPHAEGPAPSSRRGAPTNVGLSALPSGLRTSAAVWRLHAVTVHERSSARHRLLAYGAANGIIGVVDIDALEGTKTTAQDRERAVGSSSEASAPESNGSIHHVVHTSQTEPICGLLSYSDEGLRYEEHPGSTTAEHSKGAPKEHLLALSESGVVMLFDIDYLAFDAVLATRDPSSMARRPLFPGARVDRFMLPHPARAIAIRSLASGPPELLVGTNRGKLRLYKLRFPKHSTRRADVKRMFDELGALHDLTDSVAIVADAKRKPEAQGSDGLRHNKYSWLHVLDVGDETLLRYALWAELQEKMEPVLRLDGETDPGESVGVFQDTVEELASALYRRRPFSKRAVKILWQEGARLANRLAEIALDRPPMLRQSYLSQCRSLKEKIDDLSNRWIGYEQSIESKVLAHSFNGMLHWTDIVILAERSLPPLEAEERTLRNFLLQKVIRRRLLYSDSMVPLEALRVINAAVMHTLMHAQGRTFHATQGPDADAPCFLELMRMVGDLERVHDTLLPADPLSTEVNNFFALCLLLIPHSSLIVGQIVSESNLAARGAARTTAISNRARALARLLAMDRGRHPAVWHALALFDANFDTEVYWDILNHVKGKPGTTNSWQLLLDEAPDDPPDDAFSDKDFAYEQQHVLVATACLSWLDYNYETRCETSLARLRGHDRYFSHSRQCLLNLQANRAELRQALKNPGEQDQPLTLCNEFLKGLDRADIFEPQRSHYREVVHRWREQIFSHGRRADRALDIFDAFTRHAYRTSADKLLGSVMEMAMQEAPLSFLDPATNMKLRTMSQRRLVAEELERTSLAREVLDRADQLIDNTDTAAALMRITREYVEPKEDQSRARITGRDLKEVFALAARNALGVSDARWQWPPNDESLFPGSRAIWRFIVQEVATNIRRHVGRSAPSGVPSMPPSAGGSRLRSGERAWIEWTTWNDKDKRRLSIGMGGDRPFKETAAESLIEQVWCTDENPIHAVQKTEENLKILFERGVKFESESSGMGLHLVQRVAELAGMEVRLTLWPPHPRNPWHPDEQEARAKLDGALWVFVEWDVKDEGGAG